MSTSVIYCLWIVPQLPTASTTGRPLDQPKNILAYYYVAFFLVLFLLLWLFLWLFFWGGLQIPWMITRGETNEDEDHLSSHSVEFLLYKQVVCFFFAIAHSRHKNVKMPREIPI